MSHPSRPIYNVLVFPCASGIGQEVWDALRDHKDVNLIGMNGSGVNVGQALFSKYIGEAPPMADTDRFLAFARRIITEHAIDAIFPTYDDAQLFLKMHELALAPAKVITSSFSTTRICRSKSDTYRTLQSIGTVRVPQLFDYAILPPAAKDYPVFIKPDRGEGSRACFKIENPEQLAATLTDEHIICEYFPGDEFTVDCFSDAAGQLRFCGGRQRKLTRAGISIITETHWRPEFEAMARSISNSIPMVGAWFFQCKLTADGELGLLEVAPRIAGAMALYRHMGVNFTLLSLYVHLDKPIELKCFSAPLTLVKAYSNHFLLSQPARIFMEQFSHLYVDLDDTLLINNEVNPRVIALLYSWRNAGKVASLVTRHAHNVEHTLRTHRIDPGLFSSIIHLPADKKCSKYEALTKPAILLDDSFAERVACQDGVFAVDVDAVPLLMSLSKK